MLNLVVKWRGGEVVTRESAKLLCRGSIPLRVSSSLRNVRDKTPACRQAGLCEGSIPFRTSRLDPVRSLRKIIHRIFTNKK